MVEFNKSQRLGLDLDRHIALDAGAGTGKTTVMAERYVQHLIASEQRATHMTPPGPRVPLSGHGALRSPKKERTELEDWKGLLPSEVVAITFTRKAAAELKARIRDRLAQSRAQPLAFGDDDGIYDPRLRHDSDVEMLLSGLDEAPISTIDAFLNRLVQPYIDLVALYPSHQQISEERAPLMLNDTLNAVWRIRTVSDAHEAGVLHHHEEFLLARNRLVTRLGGQAQGETVLGGLMDRSLFVEQSHRAMIQRAEDLGLDWAGRGPAPASILLDMIAEPVADELPTFVTTLAQGLSGWTSEFLPYAASCLHPAEADTELTRFNHLVRTLSEPLPDQPGEQLVWVWKVLLGLATSSGLTKGNPTFFPGNILPKGDKWPAGITSKTNAVGLSKADKDALYLRSTNRISDVKQHLETSTGKLISLLARSAFLLNPGNGFDGMPLDCPLRWAPLEEPIPVEPGERNTYVSPSLQMEVLSDLIVLHQGCNQILARRKSVDGLHDFDDLQRFAADLLLARCPDVCRHLYPPEVIDVLDGLGDEPWSDSHISRAITLLNDRPQLQEDLHRRVQILSELRRQFRAFIIDEYQDTNPSHYRLLARLWGRRAHHADDPARPSGLWDPTVCIVGDMKQSIYRFRQAEVSVMRRAVATIRLCNSIESNDSRLDHLRQAGCGRDPRPVGAGGETGSFSNEHTGEESAPHSFVSFDEEDVDGQPSITGDRLLRRHEGHIDLTSNHRTRHDLMETMNDMFDEVFDPRYHALPGDWHAEAQRLRPARDLEDPGVLEWLLPIQGQLQDVSMDLDVPLNTFEDPNAKGFQLEHELLADRVQALLNNSPTQVWSTTDSAWTTLEETGPDVRPEDIMILINSRTHLPDMVERLRARSIPVMADRQGLLLLQPVIQPLMSLLALMANPCLRKAGIEFARSAVVGMTESRVHTAFSSLEEGTSVWPCLISNAPSPAVAALLERLHQRTSCGAIYDVFDDVLDHSDLFVVYCDDAQRQHAEAWLAMIHSIGTEVGHDASALYRRMGELRTLGRQGPQAITRPGQAAVQIMTIHGSKGLQAPVVMVTGLFSAGMADASISVQDNVLVTPQVIAGRLQPYVAKERPEDGLWAFASQMNKAQDKAELRRKFYVALTRVKDRLIITGSPGDRSTFNQDSGLLSVKIKPDPRTMGRMFVEGLRRAAWCANDTASPWLLQGDAEKDELPLFNPSNEEVALNPAQIATSSPLGEEGVQGIRIYHHPSCFGTQDLVSPQQRARHLQERLSEHVEVEVSSPQIVVHERAIKGAAHHLDATNSCPRKYWLEHVKGWVSEPFRFPNTQASKIKSPSWPEATEFGLMMHRVLEIGLRNPLNIIATQAPLDREWLHESEEEVLASSTTVARVMNEFGYGETQTEGTPEAKWRDRLMHIANLIDKGILGQWVKGDDLHSYRVEAVRTELPFFHRHEIDTSGMPVSVFSPQGGTEQAQVRQINMDFSGRADLVLALADEEGKGALQVVDLKTQGCLQPFNEADHTKGHGLQMTPPTNTTLDPIGPHERAILDEHRLQLTLYSMALEAIEQRKPKEDRRSVLPPAILIGANGRMVQLTSDEFEQSRTELLEHLFWRSMLHLNPETEAPPRLPAETKLCEQCPFYRGDVRRCGPEGEPLGLQ